VFYGLGRGSSAKGKIGVEVFLVERYLRCERVLVIEELGYAVPTYMYRTNSAPPACRSTSINEKLHCELCACLSKACRSTRTYTANSATACRSTKIISMTSELHVLEELLTAISYASVLQSWILRFRLSNNLYKRRLHIRAITVPTTTKL
jgi:hypothetical protein